MSQSRPEQTQSISNKSNISLPFQSRLVLFVLLVALVPLIIIATRDTLQTQQTLTNVAEDSLKSGAVQTANSLDNFVQNTSDSIGAESQLADIINFIEASPTERTGTVMREKTLSLLKNLSKKDSLHIISYAIVDVKGNVLLDSATDLQYNEAEDAYFQSVQVSNKPIVTAVTYGNDKIPSITFAKKIEGVVIAQNTGEYLGILRVKYNSAVLQDVILKSVGTSTDASVLVLDQLHIRMADSQNPELILKSVVPLNTANYLLAVNSHRFLDIPAEEQATNYPDFESALGNLASQPFFRADLSQNTAGDDTIAVAYMQTQPWIITYSRPTSIFLADVQKQTRTNIILVIGASIIISIIATWIARSLTNPIIELANVANSISQGDLKARAKVSTSDEIGALASAFNSMTDQLQSTLVELEQRVADHTKALAISTEISRRISTILNRKDLVTEVVNQVNNAFGYYHTQIYFYDETNENLVLAGGTGEAGEMMLAQFHKVVRGRGLVGRAAETNKVVLVSDISQNPEWLPNTLLPDTKSEAVIPISIGNQVLGALDVHHNITDGLRQEDVDSLQSIANQVAVALQNIRQYENTQKIAADMGVVANVGIATSTITESGKLLQEVVDLSKKSFNLYHAHIYLLNEAEDSLDLTSGAGEVGKQMVSEKRSIPLDNQQSLVARAARTREGVLVNDVTTAPDFLPNPLLPDTRSEMAVPMIVAGKVIGVLDVQSETVNRFTNIDLSIQTTLASQVAGALQNTRSLSLSQRQAERETAVNLITRKIQNTTSVEAALKIAARELGHALGMKTTQVTLEPEALAGEPKGN